MRIRHALIDDFSAVWPLLSGMGQTDDEVAAVHDRFVELVADSDHAVLVAEHDGSLIGYAWVHDYGPHLRNGHRTARWNDLFVALDARKIGAGKKLFEAVRSWSVDRNIKWLQWQASESAVPFYERLGMTGDSCPDPEHPFFEIEF